nr:hypothetical protein [Tanacetum cinerariifolium]
MDQTRGQRDTEKVRSLSQQALQHKLLPGALAGLQKGLDLDRHRQKPPTLDCNWNKTLSAVYRSIQPWISKLVKQVDSRSSFNELMDTPLDFSNFLMNQVRVDTLTPELLVGPTYELMKGSCKSLVELEYHLEEVYKAITDQLDWVNPKDFSNFLMNRVRVDTLTPELLVGPTYELMKGSCKSLVELEYHLEEVYKAITDQLDWVNPKEWHSYKHLDWITVRRDDDKLYKFKEGNFKRLHIQDIEDMLLLLVQGKLSNLRVKERFNFNVSL